MHNILLAVSAKAFQKNLEIEASGQNREEFGNLELVVDEQVPVSASIFHRFIHWIGRTKVSHSRIASPKLKNKIV